MAAERNVMWSPWDEPGLEHLRLVQSDRGIVADSMILRVKGGSPLRAQYRIHCDLAWNIQDVEISLMDSQCEAVRLRADGQGHWTDESGSPLLLLEGCIDVDISVTPFTNTLPIRRLSLKPGQAADIAVVYIAVPEMDVKPVKQRYTCLQASAEGGLYRYKGLSTGFTANLPVDGDGLVLDYPELCRRVWSSG